MALTAGHVTTLNNGASPLSSSHSSLPGRQDVDLALAAQQTSNASWLSRGVCNKSSMPVVRAAATKNGAQTHVEHREGAATKKGAQSHVEHHREGENKPQLPEKLDLKWLDTNGELKGLKMEELALGGHGLLLGSRIPKHYFLVRGFGETDHGDGSDPWETGSYDLALEDAGIQDLNVIKYTSVIPPESEPITALEAKPFLRHGAVMESIMSVMHGVKGDRITAGVARVQIRRKKDNFHIGGYAAEYEGHASAEVAKTILKSDLDGIFRRRFDESEYECFEEDFTIQEGEVTKSFGSVLASICFVTYVLPAYSRS